MSISSFGSKQKSQLEQEELKQNWKDAIYLPAAANAKHGEMSEPTITLCSSRKHISQPLSETAERYI